MDRRSAYLKTSLALAIWVVPVAVCMTLWSSPAIPADVRDWLVKPILMMASVGWTRYCWRRHRLRQVRDRRANDIEWLRALSEHCHDGSRGPDSLRHQLNFIESDYEAYASQFPDLEDRLSEARTALRSPPDESRLW